MNEIIITNSIKYSCHISNIFLIQKYSFIVKIQSIYYKNGYTKIIYFGLYCLNYLN